MPLSIDYGKINQLLTRVGTPNYSQNKLTIYNNGSFGVIVYYRHGVNADGDHEKEIIIADCDERLDPESEESIILDVRQKDNSPESDLDTCQKDDDSPETEQYPFLNILFDAIEIYASIRDGTCLEKEKKDRQIFMTNVQLLKPWLDYLHIDPMFWIDHGCYQCHIRASILGDGIIMPCTPPSLVKVLQYIFQQEAEQRGTEDPDIFSNPKSVVITAGKGFMKVNVIQNDAA